MPLYDLARGNGRGVRGRSRPVSTSAALALVGRGRAAVRGVPANFETMSNRQFRSQRSKVILKMATNPDVEPETEKILETPNVTDDPSNYFNNIYTRPYSMTSSVFQTFCDTQTTNNCYHLLSLDIYNLRQALFIDNTVHDRQIACPQPSPTLEPSESNTTANAYLMCDELMPPRTPCSYNISNTVLPDYDLPAADQLDFDSDDSVRDKNYCPSHNSSDSSDEIPETPMPKVSKRLKKTKGPQISLSTVANTFTQIARNVTLRLRRSYSVSDVCEKTTTTQRLQRKRRNTVDINNYVISPANNTLRSSEPETSQQAGKRKKYKTSLQQRKLEKINKRKSEHEVKPGCNANCIKKCGENFTQEDRKAINEAYWEMSWQEQHAFVNSHTCVAVPKRKIVSDPIRKPKRVFALKKLDDTRINVCKVFFLTTLGYIKTNDRILHSNFGHSSTDKRGKHQKTPKFDRDLLTQHVEMFNPLEPHYRREHAPLRRYLPSDINITLMHQHFCKNYPDKNISYSLYRSHVKNMNISFSNLGNEECEVCEGYLLHKRETSHDANIEIISECVICVDWKSHHERYVKARELYTKHKKEPQNSLQVYCSADLEKVIMLPRLEMFKAAIFCPRLIVYNQTFAPLGKITADTKPLTVLWHDAIAGRKQEDIMSAFYHFLLRNRDVSEVHLWLDNCSSQNKNWLLYSMLVHLINSDIISTNKIVLYYFEPGHTFMSSDQVHHQVELALKKKVKVYDFHDFEECVASINNSKVIVKTMSQENFLNIPNYVSDRRIQTSNPRAYLKNMVEVCFTRNNTDLRYKKNFDDAYISLRFMNDKYLKNPRLMKLEFRTEPKCIEPKRKADILEKLSSIIPTHKLLFWKNLPTKENADSSSSHNMNRLM